MQEETRACTLLYSREGEGAHVIIGPLLVWVSAKTRVLRQYRVDISTRILKELIIRIEYHQRDVAVTKDAELHRLLHQPILAFREGYLHNTHTHGNSARIFVRSSSYEHGRVMNQEDIKKDYIV
jgi:hypothetical protein